MTRSAAESIAQAVAGDELPYTDAALETSFPFRFARIVARAPAGHVMSYAYGASAGALFGALLSGATLFTANAQQMSVADFHHWLDVEHITSLQCPPSVLRDLAGIALRDEDAFP